MKAIQKIFVMIFLFLSIAGIIALNTRVILAESISNKEEKKFSEQNETKKQQQTTQSPDSEQSIGAEGAVNFLKISKGFISGKTGKATKIIEIWPNGQVLVRSNHKRTINKLMLKRVMYEKINELLEGDELINENITDCDSMYSTDASSVVITIYKLRKTVSFRQPPNCRLPAKLETLAEFFERVEEEL